MLVLASIFIFHSLFDKDFTLEIAVEKRAFSSSADTIGRYPDAVIVSASKINILHPNFVHRLLAPGLDSIPGNLYWFLMIGICIIGLLYFQKFTLQEPFSRRTYLGVRALSWLMCFILIVHGVTNVWLNSQVKELTNGQYRPILQMPMLMPEFWIFLVLQRVVYIFRKGYQLSLDQQYTI